MIFSLFSARRLSVIGIFIVVFTFQTTKTSAQTGWEWIEKNDFTKATEVFRKNLEKDSTEEKALQGMLFISETIGDERSYYKYVNTLVSNHFTEDNYLLFQSACNEKTDKLLEQKNFSERVRIEPLLNKADELYRKRKTEESDGYYKEVFGNYNWSFIGPFKNINGSGHILKSPVENSTMDTSKVYVDEEGDEFKWVCPSYISRRHMIRFKDHLKYNYRYVYFANTFVELPEKRKVYLRITRSQPMKIWVDDFLVFDNNGNTGMEWDNEVVELEMKAGIHRILVKSSSYNRERKSRHTEFSDAAFSGSYNYNGESYDEGFSMDIAYSQFDTGPENHYNGNFELRFTDAQGKILKDLKSYTVAPYASESYTPKVESFFVIRRLQEQIVKTPEDLFSYYALLKAYEKYRQLPEGEETIIRFYRSHPSLVFAKYLAYKIYHENGKREKAYEVLNGIDDSKTPIFDILFEKLEEMDKVNDEERYIGSLNTLKKISPSNYHIIQQYIDYYEKKGMSEEKEAFIRKTIKEYPDYEETLKAELKTDLEEKKRRQKEMLRHKEDYSYKKNIRDLKRDVKANFSPSDYLALIKHYEEKDDYAKIIALYDELTTTEPYEADYYYKKASYLLEEEQYDLSLEAINKALSLRPSDPVYYEIMGDIYYEKKEKEKALACYRMARKAGGGGWSYTSSTEGSLADKIEKIEGQKQLKKLFNTLSFKDILSREDEWKDLYKDEESVVLMYTRDVVIDSSRYGETFDKIMIKILSDGGVKKWVEYDFGFLGNLKSARIIKKSGAELIPEGRGGYKVFKNLEPGDIIQIEAGSQFEVTKGIEDNNYFFTYMNFEAPTFYSKLEVAVPEGRPLQYLHHKLQDNLSRSKEKGFDFYRWEYKMLPKIVNEEASIDKLDPYCNIMISLIPEWQKIADWYGRITYRKLESNYEVRDILDSLIKPGMTDKMKVEAIYNYLTRNIKYSFVPFLQSGYVPKDPGLTVCSRIGDCKDVATLMITMLREAGIEAYYVLVKTNDYFHNKILPSMYFNHVIAGYNLEGKMHYSDMTTDFYPYYILPEMDANAWALVVKDSTEGLFQLPKDDIDEAKNKTEIEIKAQFGADRSATLAVNATYRGIIGGNIREKFSLSNSEEQKNYIMDMMGKGIFENTELTGYAFHNLQDLSNPLTSDFNLNIFNYCDRVSGMLVFRIPYMTPVTTHPAILMKSRHNALKLSEVVHVEPTLQKIMLEFPEGYELLEMPEDLQVVSKYGTYRTKFRKTTKGLYVEKYQAFNFSVIDVKEFQEFKKFYLEILDMDSSKIALKKKKKGI